jgi:hypothetical protein
MPLNRTKRQIGKKRRKTAKLDIISIPQRILNLQQRLHIFTLQNGGNPFENMAGRFVMNNPNLVGSAIGFAGNQIQKNQGLIGNLVGNHLRDMHQDGFGGLVGDHLKKNPRLIGDLGNLAGLAGDHLKKNPHLIGDLGNLAGLAGEHLSNATRKGAPILEDVLKKHSRALGDLALPQYTGPPVFKVVEKPYDGPMTEEVIENARVIETNKAKMNGILDLEEYAYKSVENIPAIELESNTIHLVTEKIMKDALDRINTLARTSFSKE